MLRELLVSFTLVTVTVGSALPALKRESEWEGRIVGGTVAQINQFPYQCAIRRNNVQFCGGSILNNRYILTAAHCTVGEQGNSLSVVVGALNRTNDGVVYQVEYIINHDYNPITRVNDISLIKTTESIEYNDAVQSIGVATGEIPAGLIATASGWGRTSSIGSSSNSLLWVQVPTISNEDCKTWFQIYGLLFLDTFLCAGGAPGKGVCMGDSGGPLVYDNVLIGIVSWGIPCGTGFPDVYTRVSLYIDWLRTHIV